MPTMTLQPAEIDKNFKYIRDSDGNRIPFNDPRVVHVWTVNYNRHCNSLLQHIYKRRGLQLRISAEPSNHLIRKSKQVCSGKECPALNPLMGAALQDMKHQRKPDEITLYYGLDCIGPCPSGAWPLTCDAYVKKLQIRNVFFPGSPALHNNYLGQGIRYSWELFCAIVIGDILAEAEVALRLTATDPTEAMRLFDEESELLCQRAGKKGLMGFEGALRKWARAMARIPRRETIDAFPRLVMISGGNGLLLHRFFIDYFVEQQILVKLNPMADFISHIDSDLTRLVAYQAAQKASKQHAIGSRILAALSLFDGSGWEKRKALLNVINAKAGDISIRRYRRIARKSRLLFAHHASFAEQSTTGDSICPDQLMLEATANLGLLQLSINSGQYDAGFHSNSFNCFHGVIGQALCKDLAGRNNFPFVVLEFDEIGLTAQNRTLLETLCAKAKKNFARRKSTVSAVELSNRKLKVEQEA
ncbi:MAG: hypothetical protein P8X63_07940, partial [Desulfuromonadaceae bacterium]